jgi:hypothetical protein
MLIKCVLDVGILNFKYLSQEQVMAHIQNHTNTTSKHKNCTIFPLILREIDADKTRSGSWNSKFKGSLRRTNDGSHPEPHKTQLRILKIAPFFL